MNESFEDQLRRALAPVDAPPGFAERVLAALPERHAPVQIAPLPAGAARPHGLRRFLVPTALAASLLVAVLAGRQVAIERELRDQQTRGLAARREVMEALRVTSQKLDLVYQAMKPRAEPVEENRS